jgi:hypothetical protein
MPEPTIETVTMRAYKEADLEKLQSKVITPSEFFNTASLYEEIPMMSFADRLKVLDIIDALKIDTYCTECSKDRVFENVNSQEVNRRSESYNIAIARSRSGGEEARKEIEKEVLQQKVKDLLFGFHSFEFQCVHDPSHKLFFSMFVSMDNYIKKIGQLPSIADLEAHHLNKYKKVLAKNFVLFKKAIGLASHGVGIGSYAYLRRIFEDLISQAHDKASQQSTLDEGVYEKERVAERIGLLADYLPSVLVENKSMYSILSKGIHELVENECLKHFPILKLGIESILDQELKRIEEEKQREHLKKEIANIQGSMK